MLGIFSSRYFIFHGQTLASRRFWKRVNHMFKEGKVEEGARLLEEKQLYRYAISALENAGKIEEASAVLLRLKRPDRAAHLFSKHQQHYEAAEAYLLHGDLVAAAESFEKAGEKDLNLLVRAAELFQQINESEKARVCLDNFRKRNVKAV